MTSWVSEIEKIKSIFKPSRNSNLPNFFSYSYGRIRHAVKTARGML